jgi:hypothetical protein
VISDAPPASSRRTNGLALGVAGLLVGGALAYLAFGIYAALLVAGPGFTNRLGRGVGTDFPAFYAAAREAVAGRAARVYDMEALRVAHASVRDGADVALYPWAYPPTFFLLLAPLAALGLVPAMWTWLAATSALLAMAAWTIVRWPAAPLVVLLFPGVAASFVTGPTGTFVAAILATGFAWLERHPRRAGLALGVLTVKPHLAVLVPLCLVAGRRWDVLLGFVIAASGLVAASLIVFGWAPWFAFVDALPRQLTFVRDGRMPWMRMPTVLVAVRHATGILAWASIAQAITTGLTVLACLWVWRRSADPIARALALTASLPLVVPYAYDYDACALCVPMLLALKEPVATRTLPGATALLLVTIWITPLAIWHLSVAVGQQVGPLLLAGLLLEAVRRARGSSGSCSA